MKDLSEEAIKSSCPHCDPHSETLIDSIEETKNLRIVCDRHPLTEGHILIIPKQHLSCVGEYSEELLNEFMGAYEKVSQFIKSNYGSVSSFEHGKIGQTVFHSHVHLLPFSGTPLQIVPEGLDKLQEIASIKDLQSLYRKDGQYLFFSIETQMWVVDASLGAPRFFRDRFAAALGRPERGNWKEMHTNNALMTEGNRENTHCIQLWHKQDRPKFNS